MKRILRQPQRRIAERVNALIATALIIIAVIFPIWFAFTLCLIFSAIVILETVRWINRRDDPRHQKRHRNAP
jgi:membrane protein implicated in regulation of membrane protease activity